MSSVAGRDSSADRLDLGDSFAAGRPGRSGFSAPSQVWLDGEVLSCACPDCGAPMSIRLWLRLAECRMCGAQVELSEEQARQAEKLLADRKGSVTRPLQRAAPGSPWSNPPGPPGPLSPKLPPLPILTVGKTPQPQPEPAERPRPSPLKPPPLVAQPVAPLRPVAARPAREAPQTRKNLPYRHLIACLLSALINMALIILLGLIAFDHQPRRGLIVLQVDLLPRSDGGPQGGEVVVRAIAKEALGKQPIVPTPARSATEIKLQELTLPAADVDKLTTKIRESVVPNMPLRPASGSGSVVSGTLLGGRDPAIRTKVLQIEGGSERSEIAVAMGLRWLARHQSRDGAWRLHDFHNAGDCGGQCDDLGTVSDTAGTALALLPFLGAGFTHRGDHEYRETVDRGLMRLITHQAKDGCLAGANDRGNSPMYAHGQATIVLCEAYALTHDSKLLAPAQKAVDFLVAAQHSRGGWRYYPGDAGDLSVVGWQLMALRSAQMAGLNVPEATLKRANGFLGTVQKSSSEGLYSYMPYSDFTETMTAEGLLCRLYGGWRANFPPLLRGADWLLKNHSPTDDASNMYYWYYATQVMHHIGGERWTKWNEKMRPLLIELQEKEGHEAGSWTPRAHYDLSGGRIYMTALAVCTLEVYYRHLPIYKNQALLNGKVYARSKPEQDDDVEARATATPTPSGKPVFVTPKGKARRLEDL